MSAEAPLSASESAGGPPAGAARLVIRNASWLVAAQIAVTPVAMAVNGVMGRRLGAADYGHLYLAATALGFGFLLVEFGQPTALPALVARDRARAGELLGAALFWRAASGLAVYAVVGGACLALGCDPALRTAVAFVGLSLGLGSLARACQDAIRGFERMDVAAAGLVGQQLLGALLVVPTLLLGGELLGYLLAQAAAAAIGLVGIALALRPVGISGLTLRRRAFAALRREGAPFLLLDLAVAAQPNVDAILLGKLAPAAVVGWHAASLKLTGALIFPAASLITALYPTLSRLRSADPAGYRATAGLGLRAAAIMAVPLALGCGLYPELGVRIFGEQGFAPATANLQILSMHVFLLYFSMTLGSCVSAAGRQRPWALAQVGCFFASGALDLLLIPWFQRRTGNGGLGVCTSLVLCEVLMLAAAVALVPKEIFQRALLGKFLRTALAGASMILVARLLAGWPPLASAAVAGAAYLASLWAFGAVDRSEILGLRALFRRQSAGTE